MGFATGFRTGLAAGGAGRSMMPIVQGLGSMISRLEERTKPRAIRFGGKIGGPSSYDKYVARKQAEEAAAEEKRRYDEKVRMQRQQMATQQQAAEQKEARAQEMHEQKIQSIEAERERASEMFTRSKKKEDRVEAFRGLMIGAASKNKALTEASWAALAPDAEDEKQAQEWAQFKEETVEDPNTGESYRKFTVGRNPDTGQESEKAMPAPAVTYNEDGSTTVEFPGGESQTFADDEEFKNFLAVFHPEAESSKSLGAKDDKQKTAKENQELKKIDAEQKRLDKAQARIDKMSQSDTADLDEIDKQQAALDKKQAKLDKRRQKITGGVEGGTPQEQQQRAVAAEKEMYKQNPRTGTLGYAGEDPPPDNPNATRAPDGFWYEPGPGGKWKLVTKQGTTIAAH